MDITKKQNMQQKQIKSGSKKKISQQQLISYILIIIGLILVIMAMIMW